MSSVAIAAGSPAVGHRSEADVVRSAARSDRAAFDELYRRHYQASWRLAQAVTEGDAAAAVAEGFVGVLRGVRRHRSLADEPFRPQLLAATYRAGMEPVKVGDTSEAVDAPTAVAAAFRSLPDRWRAALWLSDVEHLTAPSMAAILGVSAPVATQLAERGRHGLLTRFAQVGVAEPEHLDSVLRPLAGNPPEGLEALAAKRWRSSVAVDPGGRLAPMTVWLSTRAPRPLWAACGGLLALGLVGLGVLTVAAPPSTTGPAAPISAPGLNTPPPANPNAPGHSELYGPGSGATQYGALPAGDSTNPILAGEGSPSAMTGTPGTLPTATSPAASTAKPTSGASTSSGGTPSTPSSGGSTGGTSGGSGGGKTPTTTPSSSGGVTVPGVASVSSPSGGGTNVVVGSTSAPVASATLTPTCVGLQVLDVLTNQCTTPNASSSSSNVVGSAATAVNSTLGDLLGSLGLEK